MFSADVKGALGQSADNGRSATIGELERGKAAGEVQADADSGLLSDAIFGAIYYGCCSGRAH